MWITGWIWGYITIDKITNKILILDFNYKKKKQFVPLLLITIKKKVIS
jgi:hypothetical protein